MKYLIILVFSLAILTTVPTYTVNAATPTTYSIESVGSSIGLGTSDLKQTTLNVLQWILGILSLVAVTMIIASVFIAATNSERAEAAKKTITGAVIGLIIVLLAWAIVVYVAKTASNVTAST